MALVHLVRHGRAAGRLGRRPRSRARRGRRGAGRGARRRGSRRSAAGAAADRHQPAAAVPGDGGAAGRPLGRRRRSVEPLVAEIPSPPGVPMGERVAWLREAMAGHVDRRSATRYTAYRDGVVGVRRRARAPTPSSSSHFVAINAVIGACLGDDRLVIRSLDNTSVTVVETTPAGSVLVEAGHEADTLIR